MSRLIHKEKLDWKGIMHDLELYDADEIDGLGPVKQVQAILFVDVDHILVYKHIDGYYGLPGGSVEENENFEEALKREIMEESASEVLDYGLIGFVKDIQIDPPGGTKFQLRYWARVKLLNQPINDPAGKAIAREVVRLEDALDRFNWGERGRILLQLAAEKYKKHQENPRGCGNKD